MTYTLPPAASLPSVGADPDLQARMAALAGYMPAPSAPPPVPVVAHRRSTPGRKAPVTVSAHVRSAPRRANMAAPNAHAPVGSGGRFAAMVASGKSPALAASIGRKKYGKAKFSKMAAKGKASSEETGETGPDNEVAELAHKRTRAKMGAGARH